MYPAVFTLISAYVVVSPFVTVEYVYPFSEPYRGTVTVRVPKRHDQGVQRGIDVERIEALPGCVRVLYRH